MQAPVLAESFFGNGFSSDLRPHSFWVVIGLPKSHCDSDNQLASYPMFLCLARPVKQQKLLRNPWVSLEIMVRIITGPEKEYNQAAHITGPP